MTRLERVIEQVKAARKGDAEHRPWIFDDNGNIRDDVICGEVLDFLEECKGYELSEEELSDEEMERIQMDDENDADNTYNWGANISDDINFTRKKIDDGYIIVMMVHLFGDIRGGYSDLFAIKVDYEEEMFGFESALQLKDINERYSADIFIFSECYSVWDCEKKDEVGEFCELEVADVLKEIEEINAKKGA